MAVDSQTSVDAALSRLPETLRGDVERWLLRLEEREPGAGRELGQEGMPVAGILGLVATSEYAAGRLLRDWRWFVESLRSGALDRPPEPAALAPVPGDGEADFASALRIARHRGLLHILWRERAGAPFTETLALQSALADALIRAAAKEARARVVARHGEIRDENEHPRPLVVVAMGKLGGGELNFSSDVDLVFLYPADGESDGPRPLAAQAYFTRQVRRLVALLEEPTAEGFAYRVDTRLRPFGDSGPPVVGFGSLESYLVSHGRAWERYAWLKARVVFPGAGDEAARRLERELVQPFVYRRYLDYGVFESLREMKSMISAEVERREMADNLKLGPGGIREVEFVVQSLQLVRGGGVRGLRTPNLCDALGQLLAQGSFERGDGERLSRAYLHLRRVENALQAIRDQQVHELPGDRADRARLALALGHAGWDGLDAETRAHRELVARQFALIAFRDEGGSQSSGFSEAVVARCERGASAEDWTALLADEGFEEATALGKALAAFLNARQTQQADATALTRLHRLLPALLEELRERAHPERTLTRVTGILEQVLRRSAYLALLNENPPVLARLTEFCEASAWLADEIARFPLLLDEMLDPRLTAAEQSASLLRDDLADRLLRLGEADSERRVEVLAQFQRAALFRIAAADFAGELPVMKVSDRLTDVAEIVLDQALDIAWADVTERHGEPRFTEDGESQAAGLGVIAYGKLGGIELSYGSDLDLVFLHDSRGESQQTAGAREIDNGMFFVRVARRLTHFLTTQTASGALYEVDTRLRPSGRAGLLVTSTDAFERYQRENAWTWEHQALLRARPVAGSAVVAREFERIRADTLIRRVNRETLGDDVRAMREKMRAQLDRSGEERFDLKQGRGGIGDIEFLVQYLVLANAAGHPAVIHYSDNVRQLGVLGAAGCLPRADAATLQDVYRRYRQRLHRLVLDDRPPLVEPSEVADERTVVGELWQRHLG